MVGTTINQLIPTMHAIKIILLAVFLSMSGLAMAQTAKQERIDDEYAKCLTKDTSYSNICNCAFEAFGKWDKEMDRAYKKLLNEVKKEKDKSAIRLSQKAWLAYKDAEFACYNDIFNQPGNKWSLLRQDGRIDIVRARTLQLRHYQESVKSR